MKEKSIVEFEAIAFTENGTGYASAFAFNGLYEIDLENQKCKYMMLFPNENANGKRLYSSALHCNSKIYFIPMSGKYISIYNVDYPYHYHSLNIHFIKKLLSLLRQYAGERIYL